MSIGMKEPEDEIKTMHLYNHIDRIARELHHAGYDINGASPLSVDILSQYDSFHYFGNEACEDAIKEANIQSNHRVLDVGSGLGGPARYLAEKTGCSVVALELQQDLHMSAEFLTRKCGLSEKVTHIQGDFLDVVAKPEYDAIVSWLVFLHIADRRRLMEQCISSLKPGGTLYVEDYFVKKAFTEEEWVILNRDVYVSYLPTKDDITKQLHAAGFVDIRVIDLTTKWTEYVVNRATTYNNDFEKHVSIQGKQVADDLRHFYSSIACLFQGGNLGGVVFSARKP